MLLGAAKAGGMGALVNGAVEAAQGGSIADIAKAASEGFLWGAIGGAMAGGTAVMFNQAANTGSSLAGNYAVRQAVDVGTDTVLDTARAVSRGEDVNAKTIGKDLLTNTLMAGAQVAGQSGKNGFADTGTGGSSALKQYNQDQQAVIELAKDAKKNGGISSEDANILLDWANEYNVSNHGPEIHPNRPGVASNVEHIHIGKTGHIPIKGE